MRKQIRRISPVRSALVYTAMIMLLYAIVLVLALPFILYSNSYGGGVNPWMLIGSLVLILVVCAFILFISTLILILLYNIVAKRLGGIEITLEDPRLSEE